LFLVNLRERAHVQFERLIVLAFDLQFGLQFLDQQLQVGNLRFQLLDIGA